jgi:hypothetical protein
MMPLNGETLSRFPDSVRRPGYNREKTRIGLAHAGVGAFNRCH